MLRAPIIRLSVGCALAALLAGCAGQEAAAPAPLPPVAADPAPLPRVDGDLTDREQKAVEAALARQDGRRRAEEGRARRAEARELRRRVLRERMEMVTDAGEAILAAAGLPNAGVEPSEDATTLHVTVAAGELCSGRAPSDRKLARLLLDGLPFARSVRVTGDRGESMEAARRKDCGATLPPTQGRAYFTRRGSGTFHSKTLELPPGPWSLDYATDGTFLSVVVVRNGKVMRETVDQQGAGSGTRTFDGHGTVTVRVAGDGRWAVRARVGS